MKKFLTLLVFSSLYVNHSFAGCSPWCSSAGSTLAADAQWMYSHLADVTTGLEGAVDRYNIFMTQTMPVLEQRLNELKAELASAQANRSPGNIIQQIFNAIATVSKLIALIPATSTQAASVKISANAAVSANNTSVDSAAKQAGLASGITQRMAEVQGQAQDALLTSEETIRQSQGSRGASVQVVASH